MFVYEAVHKLREEAVKSWKYTVCDKIVDLLEFVDSQRDAHLAVSRIAKYYVSSRVWFEVLFVRDGEFYCAIVESFVRSSVANVEAQVRTTHRNSSVLSDVTEVIQNGERMKFRPFDSVVRLQRLDFSASVVGEALHEPVEALGNTLIPSGKNWKLGSVEGRTSFQQGEFPSQMVQREPQVAHEIGEQEAKPAWWGRGFDPDCVCSFLRIDFLLRSYRVSFGEQTEFGIENIQVFLRPQELSSWAIERVHDSDGN